MTTVYTVAAASVGGSSTVTVSFPVTGAVTAGDSVVLAAGNSASLVPSSVTDSQGNTYTLGQDYTANPVSGIYYCLAPAPLSTSDYIYVTFASSPGTSCDVGLVARGITGGLGGNPLAAPAFAHGTSASPASAATGTLSANTAGYYIAGSIANGNGGGTPHSTTGGFTAVATEHITSYQYLTYYEQVTTSTASVTLGATITSAVWAAGVVAFSLRASIAPPAATVTIAAPAPSVNAGAGAAVAAVSVAAPAPAVRAAVGAALAAVAILAPAPGVSAGVNVQPPAATVTISAPAPGLSRPVRPPAATVALSAPVPAVNAGVALQPATVTIAAPAPAEPHTGVLSATAPVTVAAPVPALSVTVPAARAAVAVAAPAPAVSSGASVAPPAATVTIAAPAPGTLVVSPLLVSIAAKAGTDQFGNSFPVGVAVGATSAPQVKLLPSAGILLSMDMPSTGGFPHNVTSFSSLEQVIELPSNNASETYPPLIGTTLITYTNGEVADAVFVGGGIAGTDNLGRFELYVGLSSGGTYPPGKIAGIYDISLGNTIVMSPGSGETLSEGSDTIGLYQQSGGIAMFQTNLTPQTSGSYTGGQNLIPQIENWVYIGSGGNCPAFSPQYANASGDAHLAFRRVASPYNSVQIQGVVTNSGGGANNTIFTLPSGYTPASLQSFPCIATNGDTGYVYVGTGGIVGGGAWPSSTTLTYGISAFVSLDI